MSDVNRHTVLGLMYGLAVGFLADRILTALDAAAHRTIRPRP